MAALDAQLRHLADQLGRAAGPEAMNAFDSQVHEAARSVEAVVRAINGSDTTAVVIYPEPLAATVGGARAGYSGAQPVTLPVGLLPSVVNTLASGLAETGVGLI